MPHARSAQSRPQNCVVDTNYGFQTTILIVAKNNLFVIFKRNLTKNRINFFQFFWSIMFGSHNKFMCLMISNVRKIMQTLNRDLRRFNYFFVDNLGALLLLGLNL